VILNVRLPEVNLAQFSSMFPHVAYPVVPLPASPSVSGMVPLSLQQFGAKAIEPLWSTTDLDRPKNEDCFALDCIEKLSC
jgi:hypothetical protein